MQTGSTNLRTAKSTLLDSLGTAVGQMQRDDPLSADVVHWESSERATGVLSADQAARLSNSIQSGRSLLLTLDKYPGTSPLRLGNILPTTCWLTQARKSALSPQAPVRVIAADSAFFEGGLRELTAPISFDIRPVPAVERGQSRYERYDLLHPTFKVPIKAGSDFWSRSLLNRDWKVRARGDDLVQSPLVVTGRYGAGKVVVVATSAAQIDGSAVVREFWDAIFRWMRDQEKVLASPTMSTALLTTVLADGQAHISLKNPGATDAPFEVVLRTLSGDGALLPDGSGEQQRRVSVPAGSSISMMLPISTSSLGLADEFQLGKRRQVRIGVLSGDGSRLLQEQRHREPPPAITLKIETDNLYASQYPFHAPGPDALVSFQARMGAYVGAYAYGPGQFIHGNVIVGNGIENLALSAEIKDVTTPDNTSVMALNDGATGARLGPSPDKIDAYSMWTGKAGSDNVLEFRLAQSSHISSITFVGMSGTISNGSLHWPGQVVVEADGNEVARVDDFDTVLRSTWGSGRIPISPCRAQTLRIRLPWVAKQDGAARQEPWLGEILIEGWSTDPPPEVTGQLELDLVDAQRGERTTVMNTAVRLLGCDSQRIEFQVKLPPHDEIRFYRLEAKLNHVATDAAILMIAPGNALKPITDLIPMDVVGVGLLVSRGFREVFHLGTGTAEATRGWASPDDLIWAYSRQLKPTPTTIQSSASRLYESETDMRHYVTPWCSFSNGDLFMPVAAPAIFNNLKASTRWVKSEVVQLLFADSWDSGPNVESLNSWQDYVGFDQFLRTTVNHGLVGKTHQHVVEEVQGKFLNEWQAWQLSRYVVSIDALRRMCLAEGKTLVIYSQGVPMVAGEPGRDLALTFRGMHDDSTWSMLDESVPLTTGRQMANLAFNPVWQMSTLVAWGFDSPTFNSWQWHNPVGTTEPSRRHLYDSAWRATLWPGVGYKSLYTYGYTSNVGVAYTMTEEEFQQWWYVQERQSLIAPEEPVGAGLVISTARSADPKHIRFTCGDPLTLEEPRLLTQSFRNLHDAGVSLPFAANAASLASVIGNSPLILLNLEAFADEEVDQLKVLHQRGVRLAAFAPASSLSTAAKDLFTKPGTMLIETSAATLTHVEAVDAATKLHEGLRLPLSFPEGTAGYGFRSRKTTFIVLEDWLEQARSVEVRVSKSEGSHAATACNVNDHHSLKIRDGGPVWIIELPLRSADGVLIALQEKSHGS